VPKHGFLRSALVLFLAAAFVSCRTAGGGSSTGTRIRQPGAPGSDTKTINTAQATDLSKVGDTAADTKFMLQKYSDAAKTYDTALRAGASAGIVNQRLGDCYSHLGQREQAIGAYSRAALAYEAGGKARAAEACRQAVRVLQGG